MSSLPSHCQSTDEANHDDRRDSNPIAPSSGAHEHDATSELESTQDQNPVLTCLAARATSHQPSEDSGTRMLSTFYDCGKFDDVSSVTLQDEFPWHEVGANNYPQRIPTMIVPALLQATTSVSPSRFSFDGEEGGSREVDEESSDCDSGDAMPRYSVSQKGERMARTDGDIMCDSGLVRPPSPQFYFDSIHNSVEDWVMHSRPILQDYADRQTSFPLGARLEVTIDEPPKFILGAIKLLVNRDPRICTDRSRSLGPQLIENFVDIDRWAKEYFRSRHGAQIIDSDVPALLTIVMNNFYDGQVQLIDRLVEFALQNMRFCGRSSLGIEDFAFGYDFRMSQDLPFYVETCSRIRKPLPVPAVDEPLTSQPVTTHSGRQVKLTERALAATEQADEKRNKGKNPSEVKDNQTVKISVPPARQMKTCAQPSSQHSEALVTSQGKPHVTAPSPPTTASEHTRYCVIRPSNLGLPPILPSPPSTASAAPADDNSESESGGSPSATCPKVSGSGSNPTVDQPIRLKIILPPPSLPTSRGPAMSGSDLSQSTTNGSTSQLNPPEATSRAANMGRGAPLSRGVRPRGPRNVRGPGHGRERGNTLVNSTIETTVVSTKVRTTVDPVDVRDAGASTDINPPTASSSQVDTRRSSVGRTQSRRHSVDNGAGTQNDRPSTSRHTRSDRPPLQLPTDPGHPKAKKRKLDDCED